MNLREAREAAKLTQMALAHRAGMDMAEISRLESGRRDPRLSTIVRLAAALDVTVERLVDRVAATS